MGSGGSGRTTQTGARGRPCAVCTHAQRDRIEADALTMTQYAVAKSWKISRSSLNNHLNAHGNLLTMKIGDFEEAMALGGVATFRYLMEKEPWPWQEVYLADDDTNALLLKGRQIGASTASGLKALRKAVKDAGSDSIIISPTQKQSEEILNRIRLMIRRAAFRQPVNDSTARILFPNGSRIISLPGTATSIRGYSAHLRILDEAAYIEDDTWIAAEALTAATDGTSIVQSTPAGPYGNFFNMWEAELPGWLRLAIRSDETGISKTYLEQRRAIMTEQEYAMEFEATFGALGSGLIDPAKITGERTNRPAYPDDKQPWLTFGKVAAR